MPAVSYTTYLSTMSINSFNFQLPCEISDIVFNLNMKAIRIGRSRRISITVWSSEVACCVITECLSSEVGRDNILPVTKKLNKTHTISSLILA